MEGILGLSAILGLALVVLAVVLAVLWVVMPFIIMGMKGRMEESAAIQRDILKEIKGLRMEMENFRLDISEAQSAARSTQG